MTGSRRRSYPGRYTSRLRTVDMLRSRHCPCRSPDIRRRRIRHPGSRRRLCNRDCRYRRNTPRLRRSHHCLSTGRRTRRRHKSGCRGNPRHLYTDRCKPAPNIPGSSHSPHPLHRDRYNPRRRCTPAPARNCRLLCMGPCKCPRSNPGLKHTLRRRRRAARTLHFRRRPFHHRSPRHHRRASCKCHLRRCRQRRSLRRFHTAASRYCPRTDHRRSLHSTHTPRTAHPRSTDRAQRNQGRPGTRRTGRWGCRSRASPYSRSGPRRYPQCSRDNSLYRTTNPRHNSPASRYRTRHIPGYTIVHRLNNCMAIRRTARTCHSLNPRRRLPRRSVHSGRPVREATAPPSACSRRSQVHRRRRCLVTVPYIQ